MSCHECGDFRHLGAHVIKPSVQLSASEPPAHPTRPVYGERVLVGLTVISCLIAAVNWLAWSHRDVRAVTGGVGMVFALPLLLIAIHDFSRRRRFLSFVAIILASLAVAYWIARVWFAVKVAG
jgi:hypothetical protein